MIYAKLTKSEAGNWWDSETSAIVVDLAHFLDMLPPDSTIDVLAPDISELVEEDEPTKREQKQLDAEERKNQIGAKQPLKTPTKNET